MIGRGVLRAEEVRAILVDRLRKVADAPEDGDAAADDNYEISIDPLMLTERIEIKVRYKDKIPDWVIPETKATKEE